MLFVPYVWRNNLTKFDFEFGTSLNQNKSYNFIEIEILLSRYW